jgi:cephalosporin hydroxylase
MNAIPTMRTVEPQRRGLLELIDWLPECGSMVEVGCYSGESTVMFADSGKFGQIYAVDPFIDNYDPAEKALAVYPMSEVERVFTERISGYDFITHYKLKSIEAAGVLPEVEFVYLDGDHREGAVLADLKVWVPKTEIIGGHDYGHRRFPGIRRAVDKMVGKPDMVFPDNSWVKIL